MKYFSTSFILIIINILFIYSQNEIKLLVRADDIGSSHNANMACIDSYQKGIVKSVEIMVPCAWFEEAVKLLNQNPGLDVGIHLVLNSEWENYKWRPLTNGKTITDEDGYFYPMVWPNENYSEIKTLVHSGFDINEVETELRAQIELAIKKIPGISHLSSHMGWTSASPEMKSLLEKLSLEYHLTSSFSDLNSTGPYFSDKQVKNSTDSFLEMLNNLKPGNYLFVEHPGYDTPESRAINHIGNNNVATDRQLVTNLFTDEKVIKAIKDKNIQLISYSDLLKFGK